MRTPSLATLCDDDLAILAELVDHSIAPKSPATAEALGRAITLELDSRRTSGPKPEPVTFELEGYPLIGTLPTARALEGRLRAAWRATRATHPALAEVFRALLAQVDDERRDLEYAWIRDEEVGALIPGA